jgi:DNA-binding response OmpR family regulator
MMWKILLVDDEEPIRKLLKTVLEMGNFELVTASSAKAAIELLRAQTFDAVVTDLRMETPLAGFDVVRFTRTSHPATVTMIVTAFPVPAAEWKKVGADALLTKGTDTFQLANRLEQLLKSKTGGPDHSPAQSRHPHL